MHAYDFSRWKTWLFALFSDLFLGFVWILGQIERLLLHAAIY
jgi:hypothetical protein